MSAAAAGNVGGVKWLLEAGADTAAVDIHGRSALDYVMSPAAKVAAPVQHLPTSNHSIVSSNWMSCFRSSLPRLNPPSLHRPVSRNSDGRIRSASNKHKQSIYFGLKITLARYIPC